MVSLKKKKDVDYSIHKHHKLLAINYKYSIKIMYFLEAIQLISL